MLNQCLMQVLDRCIEAVIAGKTELEVEQRDLYELRRVDPVVIESYVATRLPRRLWGSELRLVYLFQLRTQSAMATLP